MIQITILITLFSLVKSSVSPCTGNLFQCDNGQCIPRTFVCDNNNDCADGSDELEASCSHTNHSCQENEFECDSGGCIPVTWLCDNETDCKDDGADEAPALCSRKECKLDEFTCKSSTNETSCIPLNWVCDGNSDCDDASDESSCNATCTSEQFTCGTGECIPNSWRCDGETDCANKSDEVNCPPKQCSSNEILCDNGLHCISKSFVCDGELECEDGTDEANCVNITSHFLCQSETEVKCDKSLICIQKTFLCDGDIDCPNGEDENCEQPCPADSFKCTDGSCISSKLRCNGFTECLDGADEKHCNLTMCNLETEFECGGRCISSDLVCNGETDCDNNEDETSCGRDECKEFNGGCSQLCVDTKVGYHCQCRKGFMLVGEKQCEDIDECVEPGICSQVCVNLKGDYKCECVSGYAKDPHDPNRCKAMEGHASLLYAEYSDIRKISLDHREQPFQVTAIVNETNEATALDFVFKTGMIFWTDARDKCIYKAPIDEGSKKKVVITGDMTNTDGLAVDWVYNHIYWSNSDTNTIEVADFNGDLRKILFSSNLQEPRAIALYPLEGWMFWTDWGMEAKIERAGMDGSHREVIVSRDMRWPNGLTVDYVLRKIYWIDSKKHMISSCDFDGSNRRIILYSQEILSHPFSITVFEDTLYWSDWTKNAILKANKFLGSDVEVVTNLHLIPMTVHVYHSYRQPNATNHCTPLNGLCTHLCLPAPQIDPYKTKISCACPVGMVLMTDGLSCENENLAEESSSVGVPTTVKSYSVSSIDYAWPEKSKDHSIETMIEETATHVDNNSNIAVAAFIAGVVVLCVSGALAYIIVHYRKRNGADMNFDNPVYKKTTTTDDGVNMNQRFPQNGSSRSSNFPHIQYGVPVTEDAVQPLTKNHQLV